MIGQLSRFAGVGVAATLIHVFVALSASSVFGVSPQVANSFGFATAVVFSYLGHGKFTFSMRHGHRIHAPRFLATALLGFAVSSTITQVVAVWAGAPLALAMAVVAVAVPAVSFLLFKFWVFEEPQPGGP